MAKKFPEIKEKNEGKFTKWVEKNMPGTDTCKAASKIMRSKTKKYSPSVVKMANYANNFGCKTKKEGASMDHGKKGASFNPKLKKAVADGKIKNKKFADAIMGSSMKDKDIKSAKKQIRKGANVLGGGNIIDDFGHKHGYQSAKTKELDNSRLVQRKKKQYVKQEAKSNIKRYRGKENKEGFNDPYFKGKGNKIRKQEIKDIKQTAKTRNKTSKKYAKASRIIAKAKR